MPRHRLVWLLGWVLCCLVPSGCAHIDKGEYGIKKLRIEGAEAMSGRALSACLVTHERERFDLALGTGDPQCSQPPFADLPPRLALWSWPWKRWPLYNSAVLEHDLQRIERWYRARGFYNLRILDVRLDPDPDALETTQACADTGCTLSIEIVVDEGEPLLVGDVRLEGYETLDPVARKALLEVPLPLVGTRFDEAEHDRTKIALAEALAEASYAAAGVKGEIILRQLEGTVHLRYIINHGLPFRLGETRLFGQKKLPAKTILKASSLQSGAPFYPGAIKQLQQDIYALGAFSSVEVERQLNDDQSVDTELKVTPLPKHQFRLGFGITSGALQRTDTGDIASVPQWDIHLLGMYERRHVLWGIGKLRIEERPRLIFRDNFPGIRGDVDGDSKPPRFGNLLKISLNQIGLLEARTDLFLETLWDYGPEPYLAFERHDIALRLGAKRAFWRRRIFGTLAFEQDFFIVGGDEPPSDGTPPPDSYGHRFLEMETVLDLRNDRVRPRRGFYASVLVSEAFRSPGSAWSSTRLLPEARAYVPLPWGMVLAGRFAVGMIFIRSSDFDDDGNGFVQNSELASLGPDAYRLRGGGASSNRGFLAGNLGCGRLGGIRRWESSAELRIPFGRSVGLVGFADFGQVSGCAPDPTLNTTQATNPHLDFAALNTSVGFGLRFFTPVGPIRFDTGFRVCAWRHATGDDEACDRSRMPLFNAPGAMHLTIGESF